MPLLENLVLFLEVGDSLHQFFDVGYEMTLRRRRHVSLGKEFCRLLYSPTPQTYNNV